MVWIDSGGWRGLGVSSFFYCVFSLFVFVCFGGGLAGGPGPGSWGVGPGGGGGV